MLPLLACGRAQNPYADLPPPEPDIEQRLEALDARAQEASRRAAGLEELARKTAAGLACGCKDDGAQSCHVECREPLRASCQCDSAPRCECVEASAPEPDSLEPDSTLR